MTVQDAISIIKNIEDQAGKLRKAYDDDQLPGYIYADDIVDILMEYRQVILEMKLSVKKEES